MDDSVVNNKGMGAAVMAALVLALCAGNAQAQQVQVSGNATLTSDYVWRGSTQTTGDPAAQAGIKVASHGWYASGWGSNVAFTPDTGAHTEFDLVAGWSGALSSNWSVDLNLTRYLYPGTGRRLDWTEGNATLSWRQYGWLQVAHSSDALAGGHAGTYAQLGARLPLGQKLRLEAAVGHYWLDARQGPDYTHGQLSAIATLTPAWELRATLHDTDNAARRLFPGAAGGRFEVALQGSF